MNDSTPRYIYAFLCAVGFVVILFGAWWEMARFRRMNDKNDTMPRQLRMRLASAVLWLLIFGLNFYAVLFLWPTAAPRTPLFKSEARTLAIVMAGAFSLLFPALVLLLMDVAHTARERREHQLASHRQMAEILRVQGAAKDATNTQREEERA